MLQQLTFPSTANRTVENNLAVQRDNPNGANYYGDLFVNALANSAATLADLMAVPGGIIDQSNVGSSLTQPSADPPNAAPTDITLSNTSDRRGSHVGAVVGALAAVDPDSGDTFTFTLVDNAGGHFAVSGANLVLAKAVDYETAQSQTVTVKVTNSAGNSFEKDLTIHVTDAAPGAPTDVNSGQNTVVEGAASGTAVGITAHASDVNGGTVTYSLDDDAGGRFAIDPETGIVTVANASLLNHRLASSHTITVSASDPSGAYSTATFDIAVGKSTGTKVSGTSGNDKINLKNGSASASYNAADKAAADYIVNGEGRQRQGSDRIRS